MSDTTLLKDEDVFPAFYSIPEATESPVPDDAGDWWLMAQIKANMTLTKPTLIATDRTGMDFAIIFEDTSFDLKGRGLKKGCTMVVPRARRTEKGEGKKAIVRVEKEDCTGVKVGISLVYTPLQYQTSLILRTGDTSLSGDCHGDGRRNDRRE